MNEANLDRGTYEIIRDRLAGQARELGRKAEDLNRRRLGLFGTSEMALVGNERIRTENNCVPRDLIAVGSRLLFGYNVFIGLRRETRVRDVLTLHRFGRAPGSPKAKTARTEEGGGPAEDAAAEASSGGSGGPSGDHEPAASASAPGEDFVIEPLTSGDPDHFLSDEKFVEDFAELYRYYKDARLLQLRN
ncbi:MAG TPA: DNA repair ATPase, partial [Acidobacteriota bacterium]|nr:DNA repair ATPase [Acidobacteriota bacterium]